MAIITIFSIPLFLCLVGLLAYATADLGVEWAKGAYKAMILKQRLEQLNGGR